MYVQYACTQPVSIAPGMKMWRRPFIGAQWLFLRSGLGATNHFEAGGFVRSNEDVAYPNLMFHFLPIAIRYDGSAPRATTATRCTSARCTPTRAARSKITSADPRVHPAMRFNYLSTDQDRREWVEAIRVARDILTQPAFDSVQRRRDVTRAERRDRRGDPRSGSRRTARPPCTPRAPPAWASTTCRCLDPLTMRVHGLEGLRVVDASVDALRHEREHLRAGDDDRREGGRPDPRQHAAGARAGRRSTATAPG